MNILIGILSSLAATIIWVFITILYDSYSRKNIDYILTMALSTAGQFQNAIEYNEYDLAMSQIDRIQDFIREIHSNIKVFTYSRNKKRLILTLLHHLNRITEIIKNIHIGYSGEQELLARCERIRRIYLYVPKELRKLNNNVMCFSLSVIQNLNNRTGDIKASLLNQELLGNNRTVDVILLYTDLIELNSFRYNSKYNRYDLRKNIFTQEEYERYIKKKLKNAKFI